MARATKPSPWRRARFGRWRPRNGPAQGLLARTGSACVSVDRGPVETGVRPDRPKTLTQSWPAGGAGTAMGENGRPVHPVMAAAGPPSTPSADTSTARRGCRAFARHDDIATTAAIL